MKLKRITLGMGFDNLWNDTSHVELKDSKPIDQGAIDADVIKTLTCLINKQQSIIEQQHAAIEEIKIMMKEIKLKVEKLIYTKTYLIGE